uniref:Cytochrome P450 n=1 Tax=Panagrolaimus sp. JU765 TaxID=591449 RepID=A0AC34PYU7_9BILA
MKEFIKNSEVYSGRPMLKLNRRLVQGDYGLVFGSDKIWKNQRRFALHVLRDFGFGKPILEETIVDQFIQMKDVLVKQNMKPIDMTKIIVTGVGNIIHQLTFNRTISMDDDYIFQFRNDLTLAKNDNLIEIIKKEIEDHKQTVDYNSDPRDFIDAFLIEQKKHSGSDVIDGEWSDVQLVAAVYDLFSAGMETTSTSIRTFILYMLNYPEIQKKIHDEIDQIIGKDEIIKMAHLTKLPYFHACLQEFQRHANLAVINLPHRLTETVTLNGYTIPKNTTITPQIPTIHYDDEHFINAEKFDPTRHLDENGQFVKNEKITPFSVGKRSCLGESLARMEQFIFIANLMQQFEFLPEKDNEIPKMEFDSLFIKSPSLFKVRALVRK